MGVSIAFSGRVAEPYREADPGTWAAPFVRDQEWEAHPFSLVGQAARLGALDLGPGSVAGTVLVPHFACDPVPLVFAGEERVLVDSHAWQEPGQGPELSPEILVNTLLGGPAVHVEVCSLLQCLRDDLVPELQVDDETGFFARGDRSALERTFASAWQRLVADLREDAGDTFQVGGFLVKRAPPPPGGEFAGLAEQDTRLLHELVAHLRASRGGLGLEFEAGAEGIDELDLLLSEQEADGWTCDPGDEETEHLAHGLGAALGRGLVAELGGHWLRTSADQLVLEGVGGCGLVVDPFQVAADRLVTGPAHGFTLHLEFLRTLAGHLAP